MPNFFIFIVASILLSCNEPNAKVSSDFSGWPIEVNRLISDIQTKTGCQIEIKKEFQEKLSPTAPSGCILIIRSQSDDSREEVLNAAFTVIRDSLTANGYKILSTHPTSDKTDYRFVYSGLSRNGSITLKGLTEKDGVQLIVCLLEDMPHQP